MVNQCVEVKYWVRVNQCVEVKYWVRVNQEVTVWVKLTQSFRIQCLWFFSYVDYGFPGPANIKES